MADYKDTVEAAEQLIEVIEEDLPDSAYSQASDFFDSVLDRTKSMLETMESTGRASTAQAEAIDNMRAGVDNTAF